MTEAIRVENADNSSFKVVAANLHLPQVTYWMGRSVEELTREQLLQAVSHLVLEVEQLRASRDAWRRAGDPLKHLMAGGT